MDAKTGRLYLLEINPNCSVFYPDDNGATADEIIRLDGYGKKNFLKQLIEYGLKRQKKSTLLIITFGWKQRKVVVYELQGI